jgi:membrane-associated phospholipid phosphatase
METDALLWIHDRATPALDGVFLLSNLLGLWWFCIVLVAAVTFWLLRHGERRVAHAWVALGAVVWALPELIKAVADRPRPTLWPALIDAPGLSFPSAHSVASAALYPVLGWLIARRCGGRTGAGYGLGVVVALFVGFGRLYLGVHWPSDVLAGWALGFVISALGVLWLRKLPAPEPDAGV